VLRKAVALALVGLTLARPGGAWAAEPVRPTVDQLAANALVKRQTEVAALIDLDALPDPVPDELLQIYEDNRRLTEDLDWDETVAYLHTVDDQGNNALSQMRLAGMPLSDSVVTALGRIPESGYAALDDDQSLPINPLVYVRAVTDLRDRNGRPAGVPPSARVVNDQAAPVSTSPPTVSAAPSAASVEPVRVPTTPDSTSSSSSGSSNALWPAVGVGAAGLLLIVAALWWRKRRRKPHPASAPPPASDAAVARLLDAGRRMTGALDSIAVAEIAAEALLGLIRADGAACIRGVGPGARTAGQGGALPVVETHLSRGLLGRVLETGQPQRSVLCDAAFGDAPVAALSVPLVVGGRVDGALVALRSSSAPFSPADQDLTAQLAAVTGSALEASARHDDVSAQSLTDGLTSLANRRRLDRDLPRALSAGKLAVGLIMIDVDHFKTFNDTHGHPAGDAALCALADVLRANVREGDVVYRYGGEEFCVLVPNTDLAEATEVAERLRAAVAATDFVGGEQQPGGRVTISLGLAMANQPDPEQLAGEADAALYQAKRAGRNRLVVHLPGS